MNAAIEILEKYNLVRDEDSLRVANLSGRQFSKLYEELYSTVLTAQTKDYQAIDDKGEIDPFTFVASQSLRGAADCGEYFCRCQKLDTLGHYAALYATRIILPLPLDRPEKIEKRSAAETSLGQSALALLRLRPLVDTGLIFPVVMRSFHCEHTKAWVDEMVAIIHGVADEFIRGVESDFSVKFQLPEKSPTGRASVYIEGPEDFLEHGSLVFTFDEGPTWRLKSWRV